MVSMNEIKGEVKIDYPCEWTYKLVSRDENHVREIVIKHLETREHTLTPSNTSSSGKFVSLNLTFLLFNDEERKYYYEVLGKEKGILYIL